MHRINYRIDSTLFRHGVGHLNIIDDTSFELDAFAFALSSSLFKPLKRKIKFELLITLQVNLAAKSNDSSLTNIKTLCERRKLHLRKFVPMVQYKIGNGSLGFRERGIKRLYLWSNLHHRSRPNLIDGQNPLYKDMSPRCPDRMDSVPLVKTHHIGIGKLVAQPEHHAINARFLATRMVYHY